MEVSQMNKLIQLELDIGRALADNKDPKETLAKVYQDIREINNEFCGKKVNSTDSVGSKR